MFAFVEKNDYPLSWVVFNRVDISNRIKHQTEVWFSPYMTNVFFGLQALSVTSQGTSRVFLGNLQTSYCLNIWVLWRSGTFSERKSILFQIYFC